MNVTSLTVEELIRYAHEASGTDNSMQLLLGTREADVLFIVLNSYVREDIEMDLDFDWPEAYYSVEFFQQLFHRMLDSPEFHALSHIIECSNAKSDFVRASLIEEALRRLEGVV